jgi:hypothetical protein
MEFRERDYLDGETDDQYLERKAKERIKKEQAEHDEYDIINDR